MSFENCLRCVPTSPAATQNSDLPRTPPGVSSCRSLPDPHPGGPAPATSQRHPSGHWRASTRVPCEGAWCPRPCDEVGCSSV